MTNHNEAYSTAIAAAETKEDAQALYDDYVVAANNEEDDSDVAFSVQWASAQLNERLEALKPKTIFQK